VTMQSCSFRLISGDAMAGKAGDSGGD